MDRIIGIIKPFKVDPELFSPRPSERLAAARAQNRKARAAIAERVTGWPTNSPGSLNAWLLLVTTKEPTWRDPLLQWNERPLTLGEPHEGFFYPDPLGFWTEVRKWSSELIRHYDPGVSGPDALALTTLLHVSGDPARLSQAVNMFQPGVVLFLDEKSWVESGLVAVEVPHYITDPHRPKQVYEGFWGRIPPGQNGGGLIVGKAPQHPTTHNLYRARDMLEFLRSAPIQGV